MRCLRSRSRKHAGGMRGERTSRNARERPFGRWKCCQIKLQYNIAGVEFVVVEGLMEQEGCRDRGDGKRRFVEREGGELIREKE